MEKMKYLSILIITLCILNVNADLVETTLASDTCGITSLIPTTYGYSDMSLKVCNHVTGCVTYGIGDNITMNSTLDHNIIFIPNEISYEDNSILTFFRSKIFIILTLIITFIIIIGFAIVIKNGVGKLI